MCMSVGVPGNATGMKVHKSARDAVAMNQSTKRPAGRNQMTMRQSEISRFRIAVRKSGTEQGAEQPGNVYAARLAQTVLGHLVLQMENHTGRHQGGGPLHFAMTVTEESFDEILQKFEGGHVFTRGPYGERGKGRAFFMIDPDGNEAEVNTRYVHGVPQR